MRPGLLPSLLCLTALASAGCQCGDTTARRNRGVLLIEPKALDFGSKTWKSRNVLSLKLRNEGNLDVTVRSLRIEGDTRAAFSTGEAPATVPIGGEVTLEVIYVPPTLEGADGASLVIESDADNAAEVSASLLGRSIAPCDPAKIRDGKCPGEYAPAHATTRVVSGAVTARSERFRAVMTTGEVPGGTAVSSQYRMAGGVVAGSEKR